MPDQTLGRSRTARRSRKADWRSRIALATLGAAIIVSFVLGGSNRINVGPLLVLRPFLILCLGLFAFAVPRRDWGGLRMPLLLLGALTLVIGIQLVPLPPGIWVLIPGHAPFAEADTVLGNAPWRPLNLSPDRGWSSLLSLGSPLVALTGLAACDRRDWRGLLALLAALVLVTAVIGAVQVLGGTSGPAGFYPNTHFDDAVGLFANRNHQALFLAMGFPLLRCWVVDGNNPQPWELVSAVLIALILIPIILMTGSRSGLLMAVVGLLGAAWIRAPGLRWVERIVRTPQGRLPRAVLLTGLITVPLMLAGATILFGRAIAVERLFGLSVEADRRVETLPVVMELVRTYWLLGSGFGSFDPLFRVYEPAAILRETFFNHAHNDLLELLITGGVPALLVLLAFAGWIARAAALAVRSRIATRDMAYVRLGITLAVMLLLASLSDYPLRTPALALMIGLAVGWIGKATGSLRRG